MNSNINTNSSVNVADTNDNEQLIYIDDSGSQSIKNISLSERKLDEKDYLTDILPSFQMHNHMFNRTLVDPYSVGQGPPEYEESSSESIGLSTTPTQADSFDYTLNDPSSLLLNNLDKIQKINLPFSVTIKLTEEMPLLGKPFKQRSPLKQYLPGDMVYGFVIFENNSKTQIPFEMLLVSMECEIGVKQSNKNLTYKKKIMTTYDLEASFNFLGADGDNDTCHLYDSLDKTYVGFEKRTLDPGVPIKKFFKFKIPNYVLDDCCEHQLTEHLKTPPSFGFNPSSFSNTAASIEINKSLGYGRLDTPGSPIHVKDYSFGGEYVSYYINVQIIGTRLEAYKPFYKKNTTHQYDYIFIKNREFYIRVGKSPPDPDDYVFTNGTTNNQIERYEKQAIEAIEVLSERNMLNQIGVSDIRKQDEIIFSSNGKSKSISGSSDQIPTYSNEKLKCADYSSENTIVFKKDLFSKIYGAMNMHISMDRSTKIQSFLPKLLNKSLENSIYSLGNNQIFSLNVNLEFLPKTKSSKLPTSVTIKPDLIGVDFTSIHKLPFNIDKSFLLNSPKTIKTKFEKFILYYNKICDMMKLYDSRVPKTLFETLKGLGSTKYIEFVIRNTFASTTIDLTDKWVYCEKTNSYRYTDEIPIKFNTDFISANPFALVPSFQTCMLARLYKIKFSVTTKKSHSESFEFPVEVI